MVSDEDFEMVSQFRWHAKAGKRTVYAKRSEKQKDGRWRTQLMHRFIMGVTDTRVQVDHRDCDGLNNTRVNLRVATHTQNCKNKRVSVNNTTGYKGVYWGKKAGRFIVTYGIGGSRVHLGRFDCPKEAARHYNKAAFDNGEGFELLNDVDPLFPLTEFVPMRTQKARETKLRTAKHMESVENGAQIIKHVGVSFHRVLGKWRARIGNEHIGLYLTQAEAVLARNLAKSKQK